MSDPIRNYLDSVANLEHVPANAKRMISVVLNVAAALQRNPLGVMFSNTVTGMPMSVGTERPIANASDWPTAEQIQQALAHWHHARLQTSQAWSAISPSDRNSLKPPPLAA
jgi:hypothetical protein